MWNIIYIFFIGLLRLQQIYQSLKPGAESFQVETVKRIQNASEAIDFLRYLEELSRYKNNFIIIILKNTKNYYIYELKCVHISNTGIHISVRLKNKY